MTTSTTAGGDDWRCAWIDDTDGCTPTAIMMTIDTPLPTGTSTVSIAQECGGLVALAETFSMEPRTFEISISETGATSQRLLRPDGELVLFSGIGATASTVTAVFATRPEGMRGQAMQMTRPLRCGR